MSSSFPSHTCISALLSCTQLNLCNNNIRAEGAKALAAGLAANASITHVDVRHNNIAGHGAKQLSAAVLANIKIEVFNDVPIKDMRADSFTELDLSSKDIGVVGATVVAGLIPAMASLTECNVRGNKLDKESATLLAKVASEKRITLFGIKHDQTEASFIRQGLGPVDAILIASDLSVSASLTSVR